ncbi:MAG: efflux RND transporter periplasmic adaptor subunit [Candidatus Pacebacteria bacterium]|nr:efflux RND transporter periplasmic adaptor subunit [Candidatus Paceibacterota bacterium]
MQKYFVKIKSYAVAHKVISAVGIIVLLWGSYFVYGKITNTAGDTRYVVGKVEKGTIVSSISGSGQVSALTQVDIKSKVSGDIVYLPVQNGQKVEAWTLIAKIDDTDAQKAVRDAEISLESAQLSLDKLQEPADNLSLIQAQNNLDQAKETKSNAEDDLKKAYEDGFNTVANAYLDLPSIVSGLNDMFWKSSVPSGQQNISWYEGQVGSSDSDNVITYKNSVTASYDASRKAYDASFAKYRLISRASSNEEIEAIILDTYNTTKTISDAIKIANNYLDFVSDSMSRNNFTIPSLLTTHKASLSTYTSKTNTHLSNLLSIKKTIESSKQAITNADRSIAENTESLAKIKAPADALDIRSAELSVEQRQSALDDAKSNLADYFIYAPFDGTISNVNVKKMDSASGGTVIATLITKQQIAEMSLNEVDVAKITVGEKATLTFDAVPDLVIAGKVAEVASIGTVSQGVVNYTVKISFDTQDDRIKPGMSVSAAIITGIKQDVLTVPNSAVKTQSGSSYVEMFDAPLGASTDGLVGSISKILPNKINVEVGLSNDSTTEIVSGLKEGDEIVTRTILPTTTKTTTASSLLSGGNRGTGTVGR